MIDSHTGTEMLSVEPLDGEAFGEFTACGEDDVRRTPSTAFSHPGMPSFSSKARPIPRAWSPPMPMTCDRSASYCTVYCLLSNIAPASINGVFFPVAADKEEAVVGYCAGALVRRNAATKVTPVLPL